MGTSVRKICPNIWPMSGAGAINRTCQRQSNSRSLERGLIPGPRGAATERETMMNTTPYGARFSAVNWGDGGVHAIADRMGAPGRRRGAEGLAETATRSNAGSPDRPNRPGVRRAVGTRGRAGAYTRPPGARPHGAGTRSNRAGRVGSRPNPRAGSRPAGRPDARRGAGAHPAPVGVAGGFGDAGRPVAGIRRTVRSVAAAAGIGLFCGLGLVWAAGGEEPALSVDSVPAAGVVAPMAGR